MASVSRTFSVTPPPSVVVPYLADFSHAEAWDPGTESCVRTDSGPVHVGATWHNMSKIAGLSTELDYTLQRLDDDTIVLVGRNDTATSTDTITVEPDSAGSRITYHAGIEMHGAAKLAEPVVTIVFERLGDKTEQQMTEVLNGLV